MRYPVVSYGALQRSDDMILPPQLIESTWAEAPVQGDERNLSHGRAA
jgi:hypothetical protein